MSTYAPPTVRHITVERAVLAVIALVAILAAVSGARITWPAPTLPASSTTMDAAADSADRAARVAVVAAEAQGLQAAVRAVPSIAPALADRIELLDLITAGILPVAAAEQLLPPPATSVARQALDPIGTSAVIQARRELRALEQLLGASPSLEPALAEDAATLAAIAGGDVPSRTNTP